MQILSVASECFPLIKTGGLADVVGALPSALAREGITVVTLLPGYPAVMAKLPAGQVLLAFDDLFGGPARLVRGEAAGLDVIAIDAPHLFERSGNPYLGPEGRDWPDNAFRFAALSYVAARIGTGGAGGFKPDVIHAHDWQAGLVPAYLRFGDNDGGGGGPPTVLTIHNLAFQGIFPAYLLADLGFPVTAFTTDGLEYYNQIGFLKAGLRLADRVTTVSPTYAAEIATTEHGMGLDGLLRFRGDALAGILNGIDEAVWDPAADKALAARFSAADPAPRAKNRVALRAKLNLAMTPEAMLIGVVSRLSEQKGLDLFLAALPALLRSGVQVAILGSGDADLEAGFAAAAAADPQQVAFVRGYDEPLAHLIQGAADALLVPSRFEPCGLTQLCALRYGALPIVARVGGLNDTIIDANEMALAAGVATGFQFAPVDLPSLERAVQTALDVWRHPELWRAMQASAMRAEVGWRRPAARYARLYRSLAG